MTRRLACLVVWMVAAAGPPLAAATSAPDAGARPDAGTTPDASAHMRRLFPGADEIEWAANLDYLSPLRGFWRQNRDLIVRDVRLARDWHFPQGWELQLGIAGVDATGTRTAISLLPKPPQVASGSGAVALGPLIRWNFLSLPRLRLFAELEEDLMLSSDPFPVGGRRYNGFYHQGAGTALRLPRSYWLELTTWWAHISNGRASLVENPMWNGHGFAIGIKHVLPGPGADRQREPASIPVLRGADEDAWLTDFETLSGGNGVERNIDTAALRVARAWHFAGGAELQLAGLVFGAPGVSTSDTAAAPLLDRKPFGTGLGTALRWNLLDRNAWRVFVGGDANLLMLNVPFAANGKNDLLLGAGGGASLRLFRAYRLEARFEWSRITRATQATGGAVWNGHALALGLRQAIR
jgi:hypothetical protein